MVQEQVFLKGGLTLFLFNFMIFTFRNYFTTSPFAKLCYAFEEKIFFLKKGQSKLSKNKPENIPLIKITYL